MATAIVTVFFSLLGDIGFNVPLQWQLHWPPDTPASDVIRLDRKFSLAKDHSLGPAVATVLVKPDPRALYYSPYAHEWPTIDGIPSTTVHDDAQRVAASGNWLVVQDRQGRYQLFDLWVTDDKLATDSTIQTTAFLLSLDAVNDVLAHEHVGPLTDADFRTFEELMAERERRRVTWSLVGLAVGMAPLAVAVLVMLLVRRR